MSDAGARRAPHVVREREEGVARERHLAPDLVEPGLLLVGRQGLGDGPLGKEGLPLLALRPGRVGVKDLARDKDVGAVGAVGALDALAPLEAEDARVVPEPPRVGL